jgi:hypothetical protein
MPRRLRSLTAADVRLLWAAWVRCGVVRLALWTLPTAQLLRYVHNRVVDHRRPPAGTPTVAEIGWAVRAAGRRLPGGTCLVEALAAQLLLARHGHRSDLKIGVAQSEGNFEAHAWVEIDGRIVVGGRKQMRYATLPDLGPLLR